MQLINPSELSFASVVGKLRPPDHSLTLIVKGTFRLVSGGRAEPVDEKERLPVTGDTWYGEDPESGLRYESDYAWFKPRADLLLAGFCHTPGGLPQPVCSATFQVGARSRSLVVVGDRHWRALSSFGAGTTDPVSFTALELRYENSFGGPGFRKNPVGKGRAPRELGNGTRGVPLPNIEDPAQLVTSPDRTPDPAGFGPLDRSWLPRAAKTGDYGGDWAKKRWPWFPQDFDWGFFNAAPEEMQLEGYLGGDEEILLENIHPREPRFRSRLPGVRVRCFLAGPAGGPEFREVAMNLDTLWVDAEAERLVLVWRGAALVRDEECGDVEYVYVARESTGEPPAAADSHRQAMRTALAEARAWEEDQPPPPGPSEAAADLDDDDPDFDADVARLELEAMLAQVSCGMSDAGLEAPPRPEPASDAEDLAWLTLQGIDLADEEDDEEDGEAAGVPLSREEVQRRAAAGESLAGAALAGLDLSGLDLSGADLREADLTGADLTGADLTGASFAEATLTRATLRNARLVNACGAEARLTGCDLTGADLSGSDLTGADFSGATLDRVRGVRANLREASLVKAHGDGVDLTEANLTSLRASGCVLRGASCARTVAGGSIWEGADLSDAVFTCAELPMASFVAANLTRADLSAADLKRARLRKATLAGSRCMLCNLFNGSLEKADLTGADFRGANLYGVEFLEAVIERGTNFEGANLTLTKLRRP